MSGKQLKLREVLVYSGYSLRCGVVVSVVAAVYQQRKLAFDDLIDPERLGRISIELLKIGVKLYSVKSESLYLGDVSFKIL